MLGSLYDHQCHKHEQSSYRQVIAFWGIRKGLCTWPNSILHDIYALTLINDSKKSIMIRGWKERYPNHSGTYNRWAWICRVMIVVMYHCVELNHLLISIIILLASCALCCKPRLIQKHSVIFMYIADLTPRCAHSQDISLNCTRVGFGGISPGISPNLSSTAIYLSIKVCWFHFGYWLLHR